MVDGKALDGAIDIHERFVCWFMWGFCMILAPLVSVILIALSSLISETLSIFCSGALTCAIACSSLAWWISGMIWRFRSDGSYASGDYPVSEVILDHEEW